MAGRNVVFMGRDGWHEKRYSSALVANLAAFFWVLFRPFRGGAIVEVD